jgi:hypothetical protein
LANGIPQRRYITLAPKSLANPQKKIPAGAANWETRGELEFGQDAQVVWFMPHMHLRGKDMAFSLTTPDGRTEKLLDAKFDFNWQLGYEVRKPVRVRRGSKLTVVAHHDNSANNRSNPDSTKEVAWGDLTSDEMVLPWFGVVVDKGADPEKILTIRQSGCSSIPQTIFPARVPAIPNISSPAVPIIPIPLPKKAQ